MDILKKEKILDRLYYDYRFIRENGFDVLGVFLQGSQNYGLDYEDSDIDSKAIIVPSFEDFAFNRSPISTTLILPSNEHIDLKDIRLMHDCFRKQNINFVEILFTQYRILNPKYKMLYQPMFSNRERIARYDNYAFVKCVSGMVSERHKMLEKSILSEDRNYDSKQLYHMLRFEEFLQRYIRGVSYGNCLISTQLQELIQIKKSCPYSVNEARDLADRCEANVKNMIQSYIDNNPRIINEGINDVMNEVLLKVLKAASNIE